MAEMYCQRRECAWNESSPTTPHTHPALKRGGVNVARTPIAVFSYNRPEHLRRALESLARCARIEEVDVHMFCDAAKGISDALDVEASRLVAAAFAPRLGATVHYAPTNRGCDRSIVSAVTDLCALHGRAIVLEDDHIVSPDFLDYMLTGLDQYVDERRVYQISGFMYPIETVTSVDAFFLPLITSRSWATWDRAWRVFDWQVPGVNALFTNRAVRYRFDYCSRFGWSHVLHEGLSTGEPNWDTVWYWCVFRRSGYTLFPRKSLVWVGGWDGTGVHCGTVPPPQDPLSSFQYRRLSDPLSLPTTIAVDAPSFSRMKRFAGRVEGHARPMKWAEALLYDELLMNHPWVLKQLQPIRRRLTTA